MLLGIQNIFQLGKVCVYFKYYSLNGNCSIRLFLWCCIYFMKSFFCFYFMILIWLMSLIFIRIQFELEVVVMFLIEFVNQEE